MDSVMKVRSQKYLFKTIHVCLRPPEYVSEYIFSRNIRLPIARVNCKNRAVIGRSFNICIIIKSLRSKRRVLCVISLKESIDDRLSNKIIV